MYFYYTEKETDYLRGRDKRLGEAIERIGHIEREVDPDLFSAVVHHIVGQQISTKAQQTIWRRMQDAFGGITPDSIAHTELSQLQGFGMTFRKAGYIREFAEKVDNGSFDLAAVSDMSDAEAVSALAALKGVGVWTAEMILLFCLQRPDILSYGDLAIRRGLSMLYHHKDIDRARFERYRRRFSPYGSVASLYLWAIAGGIAFSEKSVIL